MNTPINNMPKPITVVVAAVAAAVFALVSTVAFADRDDAVRLAETQITLIQAIEIAETHQGGRAFEATLDDDSFTPEYEVDVVVDDRIYEVTVDGVSGEVRHVREDRDD